MGATGHAGVASASNAKNPPWGGFFVALKKVQTTFRAGVIAAVIGLKAVVKKLLYISPIFWDSATKVS
jgi:hypothetical protein